MRFIFFIVVFFTLCSLTNGRLKLKSASYYEPSVAARAVLFSNATYATQSTIKDWTCNSCTALPDQMRMLTPVSIIEKKSNIIGLKQNLLAFVGFADPLKATTR